MALRKKEDLYLGRLPAHTMKNAKQLINDPYIIEKYYQIILFFETGNFLTTVMPFLRKN